ncbi:dienelactone hydrolase family protein [Chelativorans alearense]|uniref:dienelactone hydrolase family protein n=1 Tax=Chelativorans alearense TaxID=2681495 RepID=UPI001969DF64|nr:dienelactone hydrolase family protein [Chelativorans alearense]
MPAFHEALKAGITHSLGFSQVGGDPVCWREKALPVLRELILTLPAAKELAPEVLETEDRGTYQAARVAFNASDESRIEGLLLTPRGRGPFPAALCLHDHGSRFDIGKEKCIRPLSGAVCKDAASDWARRYFSGRFYGDTLAERGYVVFAADALGWGTRQGIGYDGQQALACNLLNLGTSLAGLVLQEDVRAAEFLQSMSEVDPTRIAAIGFSMGAFRAWQLAALSPIVQATVAVCWMATSKGLMVPGNNHVRGQSAFYMTHPGLVRYFDYPDVAALAAPRPMLVYGAREDHLFPPAAVEEAFAKLAEVWAAHGTSDRLETRFWPGGHVFSRTQQEAAFRWLDRVFA